MEVLEKPKHELSGIGLELERFKAVVAKRRIPSDFIALFRSLRDSEKFSEEAKPYCLAYLVKNSAAKVPDHFMVKLLDTLESSDAAKALYRAKGPEAEEDFKELVLRFLQIAPRTEEGLMAIFQKLERSGVSSERIATIDMAIRAGGSEPFVDELCNLTFRGYYPEFAALQSPRAAKADLFAQDDSI